jgi:hypothetical protein
MTIHVIRLALEPLREELDRVAPGLDPEEPLSLGWSAPAEA